MVEKMVDIDEKLLSISEAAKLLNLSENTLRDWDNEGKFKALRSEGGHRRYSLDQIRKYLNRDEAEDKLISRLSGNRIIKDSINNWKGSVFLDGVQTELEEMQLATLLTNCRSHHELPIEHFLTLDQCLWLNQQIFLRCRFRKMISMQPMVGPVGLVFYTKRKINGISIEEDVVVAKVLKYDTHMFSKGDFNVFKEIYTDTLAHELELMILQKLPRVNTNNLASVGNAMKLSDLYDYLIAPKAIIENLKNQIDVSNVDLFETATVLDSDTFMPITCGGLYPLNHLQIPIFAPCILAWVGPCMGTLLRSVMLRFAWFEGDGLQ